MYNDVKKKKKLNCLSKLISTVNGYITSAKKYEVKT